ncbi:GNAT family N-acetyltransferase [Atopomonas sediminilitoris]|uniref:GNAT family N-acetyltransferase n=1 Tax=Atopomonas sediminilitoris TaxID=2919919 RepID=UPI001F4E0DCB|nr:GNAT family N-acetyltransferase [Atopomonas sediminilitoris]MCJ8169259.1 GNAT family N-acetyltransferase [Atopomonas sediminilitoris]
MKPVTARCYPATLLPLVNKFYKSHRSAMRANTGALLWGLEQNAEQVAALCLAAHDKGFWLTGLFVAPNWRQQGFGHQLVRTVQSHYQQPLWLFCHPELTSWYQRVGFQRATTLPAALQERLQRYQQHKVLVALQWLPSED